MGEGQSAGIICMVKYGMNGNGGHYPTPWASQKGGQAISVLECATTDEVMKSSSNITLRNVRDGCVPVNLQEVS